MLWWALTEKGWESWVLGAVAVAGALVLSEVLGSSTSGRWSVRGTLRLCWFFAWHSLAGGIDVARRAVTPRMPLAPGILEYELQLPPGTARVFLANIVSLMPGTLAADLVGDRLRVHVLDRRRSSREDLAAAEQHVAQMFCLTASASPDASEIG